MNSSRALIQHPFFDRTHEACPHASYKRDEFLVNFHLGIDKEVGKGYNLVTKRKQKRAAELEGP